MTNEKVSLLIAKFKKKIPTDSLPLLRQKLESAPEESYAQIVSVHLKNPSSVLLASIFLGFLGIDRFMIGDVGLGVLKIFFGLATAGIWNFIDIFVCHKKAKSLNLETLLSRI